MTTEPITTTMNKSRKHPCDICQLPIGSGYLMCPKHWRLVPLPLQAEVYRTWGRVSRRKGPPEKRLDDILVYRRARDAAVAAVRLSVARPAPHQPITGDPA